MGSVTQRLGKKQRCFFLFQDSTGTRQIDRLILEN